MAGRVVRLRKLEIQGNANFPENDLGYFHRFCVTVYGWVEAVSLMPYKGRIKNRIGQPHVWGVG